MKTFSTEIRTERLILRPFTLDDLEPFFRMGTEPQVIRYVGNVPIVDLAAAEAAMLAGALRDYEVHGYGRFACVWKETGSVIGFSGLKYFEQLRETELGYRFFPEFWGMGLATEAGKASVEFAAESLNLKRLIGLVHPENVASANVLKKLGFKFETTISPDFAPGVEAQQFAIELRASHVK